MAIEDDMPSTPTISTRGWSMATLLAQSPNFTSAERISFDSTNLLTAIQASEENGTPLIIQNFHMHPGWPKTMFTLENFLDNSASPDISVRNVHDWTDKNISLADFVTQCRESSLFSEPGEKTRYYGKDAECPRAWEDWLHKADVIPNKFLPGGSDDVLHSKSDAVSIETLMCYLGIGDTFTPCHKDLCASSGQNLMCYTENDGSSFWFMTKSGDAGKVDRYFSSLGQDLDHENHVITTRELARGNFTVYIVEQKLGDLVLVPPRSCHQVVNYGGITIKTSWSRMTLEGLKTAVYHELPLYQRVCRFETYRVKSTIHRVIQENVSQLQAMLSTSEERTPGQEKLQLSPGPSMDGTGVRQRLLHRLNHLLDVYSNILAEEFCEAFKTSTLDPSHDTHLVCDFCGCDIFQSFFECHDSCFETDIDGSKQYCVICPGCFVEGRTCGCGNMKPMQRYNFKELLSLRKLAIGLLEDAGILHSFKPKFSKFLKHTESPRIFQAACALLRLKSTAYRKVCSHQGGDIRGSHECPPLWIVPCAPCHRSRCFAHIAQNFKMHSIDALLLYSAPDKSPQRTYHAKHGEFSRAHIQGLEDLARHQMQGTQPKASSLRLYNALLHQHCRPVKPAITSSGWYDEIIQGLPDEDSQSNLVDPIEEVNAPIGIQALPAPPKDEAVSTMDVLSVVQNDLDNTVRIKPPDTELSSAGASLPHATIRKRKFYVHVEIPPLPYRIRVAPPDNPSLPSDDPGLNSVQTPNRAEKDETIIARSGLRARRSLVEQDLTAHDDPLKDAEYLRSIYVTGGGSQPRSATSFAHPKKLPRIKRYENPALQSKNTQPPMPTPDVAPNPPRSEAPSLEDRQRAAALHMQRLRQQRRNQESERAEIYKKVMPPKDGIFYFENGKAKFGQPPPQTREGVSQSQYHITPMSSQPSSSRSIFNESMNDNVWR